MGFGSYETAWTWLHKLRTALVRPDRVPLGSGVQLDEAHVKAGVNELVLEASESGGRVRLAHVENNDTDTCKLFATGQVATDAHVVTDGHSGYNKKSLDKRPTTRSCKPRPSGARTTPCKAATGRYRC